jgi:acetyl-CoA acetyltransferase family protein
MSAAATAQPAYICDALRTPIGRYGGALSAVRADDLASIVIRALVERHPGADWGSLDDVIFGCANQSGEDSRNVARMATLLAGLPVGVPAVTVNRLCGSGLEAVATAARLIGGGEAQFAVAGGVESMSRAPFVMPKAAEPFSRDARIYDTTIGWRFANPRLERLYGVESMPETAENVAAQFGISRGDQDAYALRSQQRALRARAEGVFEAEITPVTIAGRKGSSVVVTTDEHHRETSLEALAR